MFGETSDPLNIASMASKWSICAQGTTNGGADLALPFLTFPVFPAPRWTITGPKSFFGNVGYASQFFTLWAGDIRFRMTIYQDSFFAANLLIALRNKHQNGGGDVFNPLKRRFLRYTTFNISGNTVIEFTIPFHNLSEWESICYPSSLANMEICFGLSSAPKRQGVPTALEYTLEMAATEVPNRFFVAEPSPFAPFALGFCESDSPQLFSLGKTAITPVTSYYQMLKRYTFATSQTNASYIKPLADIRGPFRSLLKAFNCYRGSIRVTFYIPLGKAFEGIVHTPFETAYAVGSNLPGIVKALSDYNPEVALEFHYVGVNKFSFATLADTFSDFNSLDWILAPPDPTYSLSRWQAIGDDFIMGCRAPLPYF